MDSLRRLGYVFVAFAFHPIRHLIPTAEDAVFLDSSPPPRPASRGYLFRNTARILGLEKLAIIAFREEFAPKQPNICLWLYLDNNNNAIAAIVRGDSPTDIIAIMVARIWEILQSYNIRDWFSRVRSKLNQTDLPNRHKIPPYPIRKSARFQNLNELFTHFRMALRLLPTNEVVKRLRIPVTKTDWCLRALLARFIHQCVS